MFWIFTGSEVAILAISVAGCIGGFVQIQKLSHSSRKPYDLDQLLSSVTVVGAYLYAVFSMIAASVDLSETKHIVVFIQNILLLAQVSMQGMHIFLNMKGALFSLFLTKNFKQKVEEVHLDLKS